MKKWKTAALLSLHIILCLSVLLFIFQKLTASRLKSTEPEFMGSFTSDKTYSYDEKYYATQNAEYIDGTGPVRLINVSIYETETDTPVFNFYPARAMDFWGICWENDTYNIWTQSADIGIYCYKFENEQWKRDESAIRPEYIISKYDKYINENP